MGRWSTLLAALVPGPLVDRAADELLRARIRLLERSRRRRGASVGPALPDLSSWTGEPLGVSILARAEPWAALPLEPCSIPGMLTDAERRYYLYITGFYTGAGAVVEIGTWLGQSTWQVMAGLERNPRFRTKLHCVDDFVWRSSWMDKWVLASTRPANHESFLPWFERETAAIADRLVVHRARLAEYDGNEELPPFVWNGGPVELCFVDCGRLLHVNEAWYRELRPHFITDRSLLVLQDWQQHKAVPELWWEQMKAFTDSKGSELELIHEIHGGAVGTFLYRGTAEG